MSQPVKLASALPDGDRNGLAAIVRDLLAEPTDQRLYLVVMDVKRIDTLVDLDEAVPTTRVRRIVPVTRADKQEAWRMLERAFRHIHGLDPVQPLPFSIDGDREQTDGED